MTMTDVYKSMISQLGLLTAKEVRAVLRAYLLVLQLPDTITFLVDPLATPKPGYAYVSGDNFEHLKKLHANYLGDVALAISALSD